MNPLRTRLLDLLYELRDQDIPLIVGGGFGLFLKRQHLDERREQPLFVELPEPRSTNDIDIFLRADLLTDRVATAALVAAIARLGYVPVDEARYIQWKRPVVVGGVTQEVKLDALMGPLGDRWGRLQVKPPRVRPRGKGLRFHAHQTDEAPFLEEAPIRNELSGGRSTGEAYTGTAYVPEAFPYLLMKLAAFADGKATRTRTWAGTTRSTPTRSSG